MKLFNTVIIVAGVTTLFTSVTTQTQADNASSAINQFALNFLAETTSQADEGYNLAISPYTIWTVMAIINEGAQRNTEKQLETVLGIPPNGPGREQFRKTQRILSQNILKDTNGVKLEVVNTVFTRLQKRLNSNYKQLVQQNYNVDVTPLNFDNAYNASKYINDVLANATQGAIKNVVNEGDVRDAEMFITSALFFKGIWEKKFNVTDTKEDFFYNEKSQVLGKVRMMFNRATFRYTQILNMKAEVVELPYKDNKMSMIIVLPSKSTNLKTTLHKLTETPFSSIIEALTKSAEYFGDENVNVYLPKFKIISDLNLNYVLYKMGAQDVFSTTVADLSGISPDNMFLSRVIHKAEIDVDENGTEASSITEAKLENKIPPPDFVANRPFAYFIYDKMTQSIVFMGKYSFPKL